MNKTTERRLLWDACYNARDLGGFITQDEQQTRWQAFVRADNLARLSPIGQKALIDYGVKTIIDLRSDYELDIDPPPFAPLSGQTGYPHYVNLPLLNESDKEGSQLIDQSQSLSEIYRIQPTYEKTLVEQPEIMLDLLTYLDSQYGGTRNYLLEAGVTEQELSQICAFLLD